MKIEFLRPWMLLLLLLLPGIVAAARSVRILGRGRKRLVLVLRAIAFVLLVGAIAESQLLYESDYLSVIFVVDRSSSIPASERPFVETYLAEQTENMTDKDRAGVVFFGKQAAIETPPVKELDIAQFSTFVDTEGTDISRAIRLAMAAFPQESQKRIVLITDGNQTQGDVESEVRRAKANSIEVSVLPIRYEYDDEIMLEEVVNPHVVRENEPFDVTVIVNAQRAGPAILRLFRGDELVAEQPVELQQGKNAFSVPQEMTESGFRTFEAVVEPRTDSRGTNNRGQSFVNVAGTGKVLYLEGETEEGVYLTAALEEAGISVSIRPPEAAPTSLEEYTAYELVILSDVSAGDLSLQQQRMIQSAVRDFGIGLMMLGGQESFGSGGYLGTPVEEALPVTMDVKQRKIIPSGALALIMHTCEIPQANYWAQEISMAALETLSRHDYIGFLRYSNMHGESWLFPLAQAGDKQKQRQLIANLRFEDIGDMPDFDTTLQMAYDSLLNCPANVKHIVIMSDGDPIRPTQSLVEDIRAAKITISTVCLDTHNNPANEDVMRWLASRGGGRAYTTKESAKLPSIFIKEASRVRRSLIVEEPFTPVVVSPNEIIDGFSAGFPQLLGYVVTSVRPEAQLILQSDKKDPLLAIRRYGLGKTAAFTSDAKPRWAQQWLTWEGYAKFWTQAVRWTMRDAESEQLQIESRVDGRWVHVAVDAIDENGEFLNGLKIDATAVNPEIDKTSFQIQQTAPGRYEGRFPIELTGTHLISLDVEGEEFQTNAWSGVSVPLSPEQRSIRSKESLLRRIARLGGGRVLGPETPVFDHNLVAHTQPVPLWPYLLAVALVLFYADICVRRLFIEMPQVRRGAARATTWVSRMFRRTAVPEGPATEEMGHLMQAKSRAEAEKEAVVSRVSPSEKEELLTSLDEAEPSEQVPVRRTERPKEKTTQETAAEIPESPVERGPATGYTGSLLEAKRRAQSRLQQKTGDRHERNKKQ